MICRVAYILKSFPVISQTFILHEIDGLLSREIEILILALARSGGLVQHELAQSERILKKVLFEADLFEPTLKAFSPQLLHSHFATEPTEVALNLGTRLGIPVTFTAHGYDVYRTPPEDFPTRANRAARVITVSRANQKHLVDVLGVKPGQIRVIPNGVDTAYFSPDAFKPKPETFHIVCVARLEPVKQIDLLLSACAQMKADGCSFRCTVLGDGSCREELHELRSRLNLEADVEFLGAVDRSIVRQFLQSAHVAVLTSWSEGYPVCLLESAATGIPAVAPAVGGIPEIIVHESTGFLTTPNDSLSIANALTKLYEDLPMVKRMGEAARRLAVQEFSIETQLDSLQSVWAEVIKTSTSL